MGEFFGALKGREAVALLKTIGKKSVTAGVFEK
jgi:hypothetical protein